MSKLLVILVVLAAFTQLVLSDHFSGYATVNLGSALSKRGYHKGSHSGNHKHSSHNKQKGGDSSDDNSGDNSSSSDDSAKSNPQNSTSSADYGSSGDSFSGQGTYFTPDRDACSKSGESSSTSDLIAALSHYQFGQKSGQDTNQASMCGKCVKVTGPNGSVVVKIRDLCAPCSSGDIDLTPTAFEQIAPKVEGRVKVVWKPTSC